MWYKFESPPSENELPNSDDCTNIMHELYMMDPSRRHRKYVDTRY